MADYHTQAAAVFLRHHARNLLRNKYILFIGDSVQRGAYKDLVALLQDGTLMSDEEKKAKCEKSFRGDRLLDCSDKTNGTNFTEIREFCGCSDSTDDARCTSRNWKNTILIRYIFTTRVYNKFIKAAFTAVTQDYYPDVVCVNSTFWDITRYSDKEEHKGIIRFPEFEERADSLFDFVNRRSEKAFLDGKLDIPCLRIWRNALPIGRNARGGLLVPEVQFGIDCEVYRQDMGQANLNLKPIIERNNWDLLDGQFWFRKLQNHNYRELDGVHWNQLAHRWLTNIFLSHICTAWGIKAPTAKPDPRSRDPVRTYEEEIFEVLLKQL